MSISLLRTNEEISNIYNRYADTVYRIALMMLKNISEAEDVTQTVFIKLIKYQITFASEQHLKAWLIVTTQNTCKDVLKGWWRSKRVDFENEPEKSCILQNSDSDIWTKVMGLHAKYKLPVYLYYYEGYGTDEISKMLKINHATVRTRLRTARKKLKFLLEEGIENE